MAISVPKSQKKLVSRLMKRGRWRSESALVCYVLQLVRREIDRSEYAPCNQEALAQAYRDCSPDDRALDELFSRYSALPSSEELE